VRPAASALPHATLPVCCRLAAVKAKHGADDTGSETESPETESPETETPETAHTSKSPEPEHNAGSGGVAAQTCVVGQNGCGQVSDAVLSDTARDTKKHESAAFASAEAGWVRYWLCCRPNPTTQKCFPPSPAAFLDQCDKKGRRCLACMATPGTTGMYLDKKGTKCSPCPDAGCASCRKVSPVRRSCSCC
jgi:hypothetical protein